MNVHEIDLDAPQAPPVAPPRAPAWMGVLAGVVAGAVAVTAGMLLAALMDVASPLDDVGSSFIDRTPHWLKDLAIDWFGTNDKRALRVGMVAVLAIAAAVIGWLAMRRRWIGVAGIAAFGVVGALSAAERPDQPARAVLPALIGAVIGVVVLLCLLAGLLGQCHAARGVAQQELDRQFFRRVRHGAIDDFFHGCFSMTEPGWFTESSSRNRAK
jgi:hypothetical protein